MVRLLVDTGFLVALGRSADPLHANARKFFAGHAGPLLTVSPVICESCFFLDPRAKVALLDLGSSERLKTFEVPAEAYGRIGGIIHQYADRDIDFADAALIWLASRSGVRHILTTDKTDFSVYRLKAGKRFELIEWFR